jgi:hypothetical protein
MNSKDRRTFGVALCASRSQNKTKKALPVIVKVTNNNALTCRFHNYGRPLILNPE